MDTPGIFLNKGSFGSVYRNSKGLAVKIIKHTDGGIMFPLEFSLMLTYRHPYLNSAKKVKLYFDRIEIFQEESRCNLREYLNIYPLTKYLIRKWMFSLCLGVSILHRDNIIHRDIKPPNILITHQKELKLADFGFAMVLTTRVVPREPVGTLCYTAPEVLLSGILGKKADVWSYGCVCYEILTSTRLVPVQTSTQKSLELRNLSVRYKTLKAIQLWRQDMGDNVVPLLESMTHIPVVSILPTNDLGNLVGRILCWEPFGRPSIENILDDYVFQKCHRVTGNIKTLQISVGNSEYKTHVLKYLKNRGMTSMVDIEILKAIISVYTQLKVLNLEDSVENILIIEAVLLIIFKIFHYNYDKIYFISAVPDIHRITFQIYKLLNFRIYLDDV